MVLKLTEKIKCLYNLELVQVLNENQLEDKLIDRRQLMINNNISCRRIAKEKTIKKFIVSNNFVRGLMLGEVSRLKAQDAFREKRPRAMVRRLAELTPSLV